MRLGMITTISPFAAVVLLAGCTSATPEANSEPQSTDSDQRSETTQGSSDTSSEYLDDLYAESLHDGITPADPGTAYIEIAGERYEFSDVNCDVLDEPGGQRFVVGAVEPDGHGHELRMAREIGDNIGFNWEDEYVQLSILLPAATAESTNMYSNSMIQHERDKTGAPEWDWGSGASPVIRIVGTQVTASGTMADANPLGDALSGNFIAAATCAA